MKLSEHLQELRQRLIRVTLVAFGSLILGLLITNRMFRYLTDRPPANTIVLHAFSPWDAVGIWMKFAFVISMVVSLPYALYQLWGFTKTGLYEHERKAALRYIPYTVLMFLIGLLFAYFIVFPMAFSFSMNVTKELGLQEVFGITQYFSFMIHILLPVGILFELPIVVMFLTRIKLLNPQRMRKARKFAYLILITMAVLLTPPDFISDVIVAVPLLLVFEFSIFLSAIIYREQQLQQASLLAH